MYFLNKTSNWYFRRNSLPYWTITLVDILLIWLSFNFTYLLFRPLVVHWINNPTLAEYLPSLFLYANSRIAILLFFYIIGMRVFHTYSGIIRYSSAIDLLRVSGAMTIGGLLSYAAHFYMFTLPQFKIANQLHFEANIRTRDIIVSTVFSIFALWLIRMAVKLIYEFTYRNSNSMRCAIYGIRKDGIALAMAMNNEKPKRFSLKVFITDSKELVNKRIMGCKVLHSGMDHLIEDLVAHNIQAFLIAPQNLETFRKNKELRQKLIEAHIHIFTISNTKEWKDEKTAPQLHEIKVEDLLPRDEIKVDIDKIGQLLNNKSILVTGSAGSIGSEIVRQVASFAPQQLILIDQAETPQHDIRMMMHNEYPNVKCETIVTSICHKKRMEEIFSTYRPDYVFHAAAYKHVPMMENNPSEAVLNNILGTKVIADLSVKYGVKKFVMISTDKAVNPTNVMGCSKRICEIYTQSLNQAEKEGVVKGHTEFITTRFGNVLGSNGSVIPLFRKQLAKGGPLTVTHPDIIRFFMLIPEAVKLVLEAGTHGQGGNILVFDMGEPVKIADLAHNMILLSGLKNIEIVYTGLRDGEKLYEEMLDTQENTLPSFHEKIQIAMVREYDYKKACQQVDNICKIALQWNDMDTVKAMKDMVPEYKSRHSKYEVLDKEDEKA